MALCPFAELRLLPESETQPKIRPTQVIDHSAVAGSGDAVFNQFNERSNLESHFFIELDGRILQFMDTEVQADANFHANRRPDGTGAISIETADNLDPDNFEWTSAQVLSLIGLHRWLSGVHPAIAPRQCRSPEDPGHGYHTLFGAPSEWTPVAKSCPGKIRKVQWHQILLPRYIATEEDDMFTDEDRNRLIALEERVAGLETSIVNRLGRYTWDTALRLALVLKTAKPNTWFSPTNAPDLFKTDASLEKLDRNTSPPPTI